MMEMVRWGALALAIGALSAPLAAQTPQRMIQVNGEAKVEVPPDVAQIRIGVASEGAEPLATMDANSAAIRAVIDFALKSGIDKADIVTQSVSLVVKTENRRNADGSYVTVPNGYSARNAVRINLRDLAKIGAFTRQVLENGANRVEGVIFLLADPQAVLDQARIAALKDARRKAEQLAAAAGARLGPVIRIAHPPREEIRRGEGQADFGRSALLRGNIPIEVGLITISTEVDTAWALE